MINYENFQQYFNINVDEFFKTGGDDIWLYNFNLTPDSIVFDLGGFEGEYYSKIVKLYNCNVHVFEPVKQFFEKLPNFDKVKLNNCALGNEDSEFEIFLNGNCSTSFETNGKSEICNKTSLKRYFYENNVEKINLLKINIEGAEYEVLESLIELNFLENIDYILVQFHNLSTNPIERRQNILNHILKTHDLKFEFPFVWECYQKKSI